MEKRNNVEFLSIRMFNINILRVFYKLISFFFPATCHPETNLIPFFYPETRHSEINSLFGTFLKKSTCNSKLEVR